MECFESKFLFWKEIKLIFRLGLIIAYKLGLFKIWRQGDAIRETQFQNG